MLRTDDWSFYEGFSEVDVPEAMQNIASSWDQLDEPEKDHVTEELAGHNHDEVINNTSSEDIPNFTGDDDDQEYHGEWSSVPIPDDANTMKGDIVDEV